jgi:hypothetical protein
MPKPLPDFDRWIDALSGVVGLEIAEASRPGVRTNLKTAAKLAALLDKAPVGDRDEAAPIFRPFRP